MCEVKFLLTKPGDKVAGDWEIECPRDQFDEVLKLFEDKGFQLYKVITDD